MALTNCGACGGEVSPEAKTCIHCGHPLRTHNHRWLLVIVALCATVAIAIYLGRGFVYGFVTGFEGHPMLPSCGWSVAEPGAEHAFENSPYAKTFGLTVVALTNPQTISSSRNAVECKATVILNNSRKGIIDYSFTSDPSLPQGQYYIRVVPEEDSFKPYP